jgi:hypothetical protein
MEEDVQVNGDERTQAIGWMREVLLSTLEACPLSYQQKKKTGRLLRTMPDWLMARCADSLNIDYINGSNQYPDMAEYVKSDGIRNLVQQYLESHDTVAVGNCIEDLGKSVLKHDIAGDLPVDIETIERQVCALALAGYTDDGITFAEKARDILSDAEMNNHPVIDYHMALVSDDREKLDMLEAALTGGRYGNLVSERLTEYKRFLGLEPPHFTIKVGERSPQWDLLWRQIFTGGDE